MSLDQTELSEAFQVDEHEVPRARRRWPSLLAAAAAGVIAGVVGANLSYLPLWETAAERKAEIEELAASNESLREDVAGLELRLESAFERANAAESEIQDIEFREAEVTETQERLAEREAAIEEREAEQDERAAKLDEREAAIGSAEEEKVEEEQNGTFTQQQALSKARQYLDFTSFSRAGLIDQLLYEGFSQADAEWAADQVGY